MSSRHRKKMGKSRKVAHTATVEYAGAHADDQDLRATSVSSFCFRCAHGAQGACAPSSGECFSTERNERARCVSPLTACAFSKLARSLHFFSVVRKSSLGVSLGSWRRTQKTEMFADFSVKETESLVGAHVLCSTEHANTQKVYQFFTESFTSFTPSVDPNWRKKPFVNGIQNKKCTFFTVSEADRGSIVRVFPNGRVEKGTWIGIQGADPAKYPLKRG